MPPACLVRAREREADRRTRVVGQVGASVQAFDCRDIVVVASQGGLPEDPQWYRNLQAGPAVDYEFRGRRVPVTARTADADERAELWPRLVDLYAGYADYQRWTEREIPVVILERR